MHPDPKHQAVVERLAESLVEFRPRYIVLASATSGEVLAAWGGSTELRREGMLTALLGDQEAVRRTYAFLVGDRATTRVPKAWGQGTAMCLLMRPRRGLLLAIFKRVREGSLAWVDELEPVGARVRTHFAQRAAIRSGGKGKKKRRDRRD